jgi:sarcosine oxidase
VVLAQEARARYDVWAEAAGHELITPSGTVISGAGLENWAAGMSAGDAPYTLTENGQGLRLPVATAPKQSLIDPNGGVLRVDRIGAFLTGRIPVVRARVTALEEFPDHVNVVTTNTTERYDAVVVAAGSGTSALAHQVGLYTPPGLAHHVRFSFTAPPTSAPFQAWITRSDISGLATYQHADGAGRWTVGAHVDDADVAWTVGRERAVAISREVVLRYAMNELALPDSKIVDELYCTVTPDLGDGFGVVRTGHVTALWGENLFKLAPVIGDRVARSVLDGEPFEVGDIYG